METDWEYRLDVINVYNPSLMDAATKTEVFLLKEKHQFVDSDSKWVRGWPGRISNNKKRPIRIILKPDPASTILD